MSIPQAHLVAFCGDIGIGAATGAMMLSVLLGCAFEAGSFLIAAAYGFGFSGIIPAYVVAIRDLFPSSEASWRACRWCCSPQ
jgi:hypothetical protein